MMTLVIYKYLFNMNNDIHKQLMNLTEILITEEDDLLLPAKKIYTLIKEEKGDDLPTFEEYKDELQIFLNKKTFGLLYSFVFKLSKP